VVSLASVEEYDAWWYRIVKLRPLPTATTRTIPEELRFGMESTGIRITSARRRA
jgi:hypothetical protein